MLRAKKKNHGISKLKFVVEKLQKSLSLAKNTSFGDFGEFEVVEQRSESSSLPRDVKEGHFAVIAVDNGKPKRFVVPLCYLNHPTFLRLLEQAAEEFGFNHEGALTIPCRWSELEKISCC